ncbi:GDSL esterase/lipase At4g01130-like [Selaginella moellendorffii]|uniref:GDSL esterase/lipase At4g01130-like n=1 Tax=Selaginella moellendorffii TaxID=88036 RepID=UPI000D1D0ADB|nr:GDSL esterase/lipase At4g01130-like [Selaginella moellendorffii]|eukprot:XP_024518476.1 GDSL esterase/lipase At4g01130-like [Selaginella moellendorffii]
MRFPSLVLLVLCGILAQGQRDDNGGHRCFPAIFGFGDDWGDVGNLQALYPADLEKLEDEAPYGMSYFKKPARRLSDGRLMLDFVGNIALLAHSCSNLIFFWAIRSSGAGNAPSFVLRCGGCLEFAARHQLCRCREHCELDWFAAEPVSSHDSDPVAPEARVGPKTTETLPNEHSFQEGLYMISTGQNDYRYAFFRDNRTVREVERTVIPYVVENITATVLFFTTSVSGSP